MSYNKQDIINGIFGNKEIKALKQNFKQMIDEMPKEEFLELVFLLMSAQDLSELADILDEDDDDYDYDDYDYDEDWEGATETFYNQTYNNNKKNKKSKNKKGKKNNSNDNFTIDEDLPF